MTRTGPPRTDDIAWLLLRHGYGYSEELRRRRALASASAHPAAGVVLGPGPAEDAVHGPPVRRRIRDLVRPGSVPRTRFVRALPGYRADMTPLSGSGHADLLQRPAVHRQVAAPAADVWAVLADGWSYATWVVGAARIRSVDERWPAVGSAIKHSVGVWPFLLSDETRVEACEPGRRLVLTARGWPLGEARVLVELEDQGRSCQVEMREDAAAGPGRVLPTPVRQLAILPRNTESLRRLALLAERRDATDRPASQRA